MVADTRPAQSEIDGDIVLHLPYPPDQGGTSLKQGDIAFIKKFGDRPNCPVMGTLDDRVEKVIGMLLAGERNLSVEVDRSPVPALEAIALRTAPVPRSSLIPGNRTP